MPERERASSAHISDVAVWPEQAHGEKRSFGQHRAPRHNIWSRVNACLVGAFLASLMAWPPGYAVFPLALALVALAAAVVAPSRWRVALDGEDALWLAALGLYALIWLGDVMRTGEWPRTLSGEGYALPMWPLLAVVLVIWLRAQPPRLRSWLLGLAGGALGAASIAIYERAWLGHARADNAMNAIPFGNLSLLLGLLALIALVERFTTSRARTKRTTILLALAAAAGLTASLLSGTRGGWIALPLLCWLIYRTYAAVLPTYVLRWIAGLLGLLLAVGVSLPQTGVAGRLLMAADDLHGYVIHDNTDTSLGLRLEMWQGGLMLFSERPLFGWGEGYLQAARDELVAAGKLSRGVSAYEQLHSDLIDTAARRGALGLACLAGLYGVPLLLFTRYLRRAITTHGRMLALSGLIICLAFVDFGLSQSMLRDARGLTGYLALSIICWALLKAHKPRCTPLGNATPLGSQTSGALLAPTDLKEG